jgi:hypothetical protein
VTTAAAQAQALANGLAQSSKSIADSTKVTSQYFDSFVKRIKEADAVFNSGQMSKTLKAITGDARTTDQARVAVSRLSNEYRQLQASVTGGLGTAITEIGNALAQATASGIPLGISQINDELTRLNEIAGQSALSGAVSQAFKLKTLITSALTDTSDSAGQKIKNIAAGTLRNFESYETGLNALSITISADAQAIATDIKKLSDTIRTTQSSDVENLRAMLLNLGALQESFQAEMDKSKTVVTQFTSQADLVAASLQRIRNADPTGALTSTISAFEDLVQRARDTSKQLLTNVAEDRFKQLRDISFRLIGEIRDSFFGQLYGIVKTQLDAFQKGFETFASNIGTRSVLFAQGLKAAFQGGGTVATTVEAMATLGRLNFKAGTDELTTSAAMAVKMAEALGISGNNAAHLVFYTKQAGVDLVQMGDTLATIRENTRLTADEFGRFTRDLGEALMIMGNISNYAQVIKSTLKIDDALRQFTGMSGDYVQFFKRMATTTEGMQTAMALGINPENLGNDTEQRRFIASMGAYVDQLTKNQPMLQQIAILEDLSVQTGLSVVSLRNLSKAAAELNSRTEDSVSLDQRYANEVANLGKSVTSISESLQKLLAAGMWPFVAVLSQVAGGVAWLLEKLRGLPGVFETLAVVGGVVAVGALGLLINSIKQLAIVAPIAMAGLRALNAQLLATSTGAAVSGAMSAAAGAGAAGAAASTGIGAMLMNFLVNPLKVIFVPVAKALLALVNPLALVAAALTLAAGGIYKLVTGRNPVSDLRDVISQGKENDEARGRDAETIRKAILRRTSEARGASISTAEGLTDAERLKSVTVQGAGGRSTNFGQMLASREQDIAEMMSGASGAQSISAAQAAEFKSELAQRDAIYLRNAIAAKETQLVTESRPPSKNETDQLALLTEMVKYLERQVSITQNQADDARKQQDERDLYEQMQRIQTRREAMSDTSIGW